MKRLNVILVTPFYLYGFWLFLDRVILHLLVFVHNAVAHHTHGWVKTFLIG